MYGAPFLLFHSPLEKTPHKAANGELTISCLNRHCPKCQGAARRAWLAKRSAELLPVPYYHVVFTLPHVLVDRRKDEAMEHQ